LGVVYYSIGILTVTLTLAITLSLTLTLTLILNLPLTEDIISDAGGVGGVKDYTELNF